MDNRRITYNITQIWKFNNIKHRVETCVCSLVSNTFGSLHIDDEIYSYSICLCIKNILKHTCVGNQSYIALFFRYRFSSMYARYAGSRQFRRSFYAYLNCIRKTMWIDINTNFTLSAVDRPKRYKRNVRYQRNPWITWICIMFHGWA